MKYIITILFVCFSLIGFGQRTNTPGFVPRANQTIVVEDGNVSALNSFFPPRYSDTTSATNNILKDTLGAVIFTYDSMALWVRKMVGASKRWSIVGSGSGGGGSGSGLFPTSGTGDAVGNVIGELNGFSLTLQNGGDELFRVNPTTFFSELRAVDVGGDGVSRVSLGSDVSGGDVYFQLFAEDNSNSVSILGNVVDNLITITGPTRLADLAGNGSGLVAVDNDGDLSFGGVSEGLQFEGGQIGLGGTELNPSHLTMARRIELNKKKLIFSSRGYDSTHFFGLEVLSPFQLYVLDSMNSINPSVTELPVAASEMHRVIRITNPVRADYRIGHVQSLMYQAGDSARIITNGGDFGGANVNVLYTSYLPTKTTGRTVFQGGTTSFERSFATLSMLEPRYSNGSRYQYLRGHWGAHTSYLRMYNYTDTIEHFSFYNASSFKESASKVLNAYGLYIDGVTAVTSSWSVYSPQSAYKMYHGGAVWLQDSIKTGLRIPQSDTSGVDVVVRDRTNGYLKHIRADQLGVGGGGGGGNVTKVGTPADNQVGVWTGDGTIEGTSALTFDGTTLSISSVAVPTISSTNTLSNKRWVARVGSTTSSATPTINTDNTDIYKLTAQAADITSFTTNLSGTPNDGDILEIQITGTASRAITWGASFVSSTVSLPTTTSGTTTLTVVLQYYSTSSYGNAKWVCVNFY